MLFAGTLPANNNEFAGTVLINKNQFARLLLGVPFLCKCLRLTYVDLALIEVPCGGFLGGGVVPSPLPETMEGCRAVASKREQMKERCLGGFRDTNILKYRTKI